MISSLLLCLSLAFAQEESISIDPPTSIDTSFTLPFLYTGNLKGFAGNQYPFSFQAELSYVDDQFSTTNLQSFRGLLTQEQWVIHAPDFSSKGVLDFLQGSNISCEKTQSVMAWRKRGNILLTSNNIEHITRKLGPPLQYIEQKCSNEQKKEILLFHPATVTSLPKFDLKHFSFRRGASIDFTQSTEQSQALLVQEALFDLTRVQEHIATQKNNGYMYVDAGSFVDGWSNLPNEKLSLHRSNSYETLQELAPTALGIGTAELLDGAYTFFEEIKDKNLPYIGTNWESDDPKLQLPKSRTLSVSTSNGTKTIAFLSILDPDWVEELPALKEDKIRILDPIQAIKKEIESLYSMPNPPHLTLLLTTASSNTQERIRKYAHGVELMLGDPTLATFRVVSSKTTLKAYDPEHKGAPLTLPIDGLHELMIDFRNSAPSVIETKPVEIEDDTLPNQQTQRMVNSIRSKIYPKFSSAILVPEGKGMKAIFSPTEWESILCESIRYTTNADSVMLRHLPNPPNMPGIISELTLLEALGSYDTLESHRLTGAKLKTLFGKTKNINPVQCGAHANSMKAWGRSIENDKLYTIITTQKTRTQYDLDALFQSIGKRNIWDPQDTNILQDEEGNDQTSSLVILDSLKTLRQEKGVENIGRYLLKEFPKEKPPQTMIRIRKFGISTEQFGGMDNPKFSSIPDTLANTASSSSIGNALDIALDYSSLSYNQDLRFKTSFGTLNTGETEQEIQDDWNISSSISMPNIRLQPLGPIQWNMFTELLYDSEYTPTIQEDGSENPQQSDLSLSLGLTSLPIRWMKTVRISGFGNRDFSLPETPRYEFGAKLEWESKSSLHKNLLWTSSGDVRVYANSPEDNESDLRLRAWAETRLSLPLTRYLALSVYGQTLIIKGRVESNSDIGIATNIGLALDVLGIFSM